MGIPVFLKPHFSGMQVVIRNNLSLSLIRKTFFHGWQIETVICRKGQQQFGKEEKDFLFVCLFVNYKRNYLAMVCD